MIFYEMEEKDVNKIGLLRAEGEELAEIVVQKKGQLESNALYFLVHHHEKSLNYAKLDSSSKEEKKVF